MIPILLILVGHLILFEKFKDRFILFSLMVFPGTLCHELCHLGAGKLLNGQPMYFSVIPQRRGDGYLLGSVGFANLRWYNGFFLGMAPIVLFAVAYYTGVWYFHGHTVLSWKDAIILYFMANCIYSAVPSRADFSIAFRGPLGWMILLGVLGYGVHLL